MSTQVPGITTVYVPEKITVHLGKPDEEAENVTVPFIDYIKNVASSELYPTWPEEALRANIYAIVSIAMNRVFTEWYRSRGYNFDITNSTQFDQSYVHNRGIFDRVSNIVDDIFDDYIVRNQRIEPLFAQYCDGREVLCDGLYQWGTVDLAKKGYVPYEILQYYYGDDISLVTNAPVGNIEETYPGFPIKLGDVNVYVLLMQIFLNTISVNFPKIPKVTPVDGIFTPSMETAVKEFQKTFNLPITGVIDKGTYYKIKNIYISVKRLADLTSKGILVGEIPTEFIPPILEGETGPRVQLMQFFINVISAYYESVPSVDIDGSLGPNTRAALIEFQKTLNIPQTGILDEKTWDTMYDVILGILKTLPPTAISLPRLLYPGELYRIGSQGPNVFIMQEFLSYISTRVPSIPNVEPDGYFGPNTEKAVIAFQKQFNLVPDGIIGENTWNKTVEIYRDLRYGEGRLAAQYPGVIIQ